MNIDLHCHSTASDGALSPTVLVARAHEHGVQTLALTDHDTLEGLPEARAAALALGMQWVSGVEMSCTWGGATIHVLGYGFKLDAPPLVAAIETLHHGRWLRAEEISRKLALKGMPGALEGARAIQKELGDVKQHWPTLEETVETLRQSNAWVSLAHPLHYDFTRSKRRKLIGDYIQAGGHAIEVVNGMAPAEQVGTLSILAREFGLLVSAGSDFHGPGAWGEIGSYRALPEDLPPLWCRFKHEQHTVV